MPPKLAAASLQLMGQVTASPRPDSGDTGSKGTPGTPPLVLLRNTPLSRVSETCAQLCTV